MGIVDLVILVVSEEVLVNDRKFLATLMKRWFIPDNFPFLNPLEMRSGV